MDQKQLPERFFVEVDRDEVTAAYTEIMVWVQRHPRYFDYADWRDQRAEDGPEDPGWEDAASLLVHDAGAGVVHEKTRAGEAIVPRVAPELDGGQVPDALAAVVGGRDEADRGAVADAEAFAVEA